MLKTLKALKLTVVLGSLAVSSLVAHADDVWSRFVRDAETEHGAMGKRAAEFLEKNHPARDASIDQEILDENLEYALKARDEFPWAGGVPEDVFLNDVLPYAVFDETRESWRPAMYERCKEIVKDCETATEAAQAINKNLFNLINVHYNTGRKAPNQSPAESMAQSIATCTGLSIILIDGCRSVGIPARAAGVANWSDKRGNHTWVEIWDGAWHFTGADEYDKDGLDRGWFVGDAKKAVAGSTEHAVWASSWKGTGDHFPMVWDLADTSVGAVDVTHRYTGEPQGSGSAGSTDADKEAKSVVYLRLWDTPGGKRLVADVKATNDKGESLGEVETRGGTADMNDMPSIRVSVGEPVTLTLERGSLSRVAAIAGSDEARRTVDLYWEDLGLTRADAQDLIEKSFKKNVAKIKRATAKEVKAMAFEADGHELKIKERVFGEEPEGGHSLWISMHGGGGAPKELNDQQWENQIRLYEPTEGIYIAPRAPTNTWNLWHQAHVDPLFDRLIETYVATRGVNPEKVYIMGYSAGGDGVYQLAPRMADRFAAASMMAGHPNETKPDGLRDLPFAIFMGGADAAYDRNKIAAEWKIKLDKLQEQDPEGYPHRVTIYPGLPHWMNGNDKEVLPWMLEKTRDTWPDKVVWLQDDVTHTRFYWLEVSPEQARERTRVVASVEGQTITIESKDLSQITLRLSDELVDLDKPVEVVANGQKVFSGFVPRTEEAIEHSLEQRNDPTSAATALLDVAWRVTETAKKE